MLRHPWRPLVYILAITAALRLIGLAIAPGAEWDEYPYLDVARHVAAGHGVTITPQWGQAAAPYLYHPPFYFWLAGLALKLPLDGFLALRLLAVVGSLCGVALLYHLLRPRYSLYACVPALWCAVDAWAVFEGRVAWLENWGLPLGIAALIVTQWAAWSSNPRALRLAGALLGAAVAWKFTGAVFLLGGVGYLGVMGKDRRAVAHLLWGAGLVLALFLAAMLTAYHGVFLAQTVTQLQRAAGVIPSHGNVRDPGEIMAALAGQYAIYWPSLMVAAAGCLVALRDGLMAWRRWSMAGVQRHALVWSWTVAALLVFGCARLTFPHYWLLLEVPAATYAWLRARDLFLRVQVGKARLGLLCLAALLLLGTAYAIPHRLTANDHALADAVAYLTARVPHDAVVLADEPIGVMIPQPYCQLYRAVDCPARYAVLYASTTQHPPQNVYLQAEIAAGTRLATFRGFKETITIYALGPAPS